MTAYAYEKRQEQLQASGQQSSGPSSSPFDKISY